jgi:hypothetical protein
LAEVDFDRIFSMLLQTQKTATTKISLLKNTKARVKALAVLRLIIF